MDLHPGVFFADERPSMAESGIMGSWRDTHRIEDPCIRRSLMDLIGELAT